MDGVNAGTSRIGHAKARALRHDSGISLEYCLKFLEEVHTYQMLNSTVNFCNSSSTVGAFPHALPGVSEYPLHCADIRTLFDPIRGLFSAPSLHIAAVTSYTALAFLPQSQSLLYPTVSFANRHLDPYGVFRLEGSVLYW